MGPTFVTIVIWAERLPATLGLNCTDTVQLAPGARESGGLQVVVVIGNSLVSELVIVVSATATVPVLVNVMTPPVNDVPPTTVFGNEKLSGVIVICGNAASAPAPDTLTETLPTLLVIVVI